MKLINLLALLTIAPLLTSCNKDDIEPIDRTLVTLSGYKNGTYELEAEFDYSLYTSPGSTSSFRLYIKKNGTPSFELFFDLSESGDEIGFQEGVQYEYDEFHENINFAPMLIIDGVRFYIPGDGVTGTNTIEFSTIENTNIKGRFELNLIHFTLDGELKIQMVGTFDAYGEIFRRNA